MGALHTHQRVEFSSCDFHLTPAVIWLVFLTCSELSVFPLAGGPGLHDPCEREPTDALSYMTVQQKEAITHSAQVENLCFQEPKCHFFWRRSDLQHSVYPFAQDGFFLAVESWQLFSCPAREGLNKGFENIGVLLWMKFSPWEGQPKACASCRSRFKHLWRIGPVLVLWTGVNFIQCIPEVAVSIISL